MNTLSINSDIFNTNSVFDLFNRRSPVYTVKYSSFWAENQDGDYSLTLEMPGIDKKDAKFSIKDGILSVKGESEEYKYSQNFSIPDGCDIAKCRATMKNGIAKVTLPKLESQKARQIDIE